MGFFDVFKKKVARTDIKQRFDLIGRVGQGSMSQVWRAKDHLTGQPVALKLLDREQTRRFEARFVGLKKPTEGQIAIDLEHPNIVETYDYGLTTDGLQFIVMEYLEGYPLSYYVDAQNEVFKRNRLKFMIELGDAVAYLHERNFIHRDICPRNVIVTEDLRVKLIDFGLVVPNTPEFRKPGNRTGTANYMAPELIRRQPTDQRIDVFSYAVTCYEMCARRLPWESAKSLEAILQHLNSPPADLHQHAPDLDGEVAAIVMKGVEIDRGRRWQSAREMTSAFRAVQSRLEPAAT